MNNFQRNGATSNAHVGRDFEAKAQTYFSSQGLNLAPNFSLPIGIYGRSKLHAFDLGDGKKRVVVECKSHTWTETWRVPSAKITTWNQAMYFFHTAPINYRKIFFVLHHYNKFRRQTLAEYYIMTNRHLIPKRVEIWEFDEARNTARRLKLPV